MAASSAVVALGTQAPPFNLPDTLTGKTLSLDLIKSEKATVVMFLCNHCPYVQHVNAELVRLAQDYIPQGVAFVAISANDVATYPEDSPEHMQEVARREGYLFPYLYDESQEVARAYQAACTPDFYVFDGKLKLAYHGQLDDSRPDRRKPGDTSAYTPAPLSGKDMRQALDALLAGKSIPSPQKPSIGCSIKWKT